MNWILDKFNKVEKVIMDEVAGMGAVVAGQVVDKVVSTLEGGTVTTAQVSSEAVKQLDTTQVPQPTVAQQVAALLGPQLASLVKIGIDDAMKGNFAGAWGDVKGQLINDGIQDAITATRALEQSVMSHVGTLGTSKQLDVAKGKLTDAFIWIEKHLGVGG